MSLISKKSTKSVNFCYFHINSIIDFDPANNRNCIIDLGQNIVVAARGIADSKTATIDIGSSQIITMTAGFGRIAAAIIGPITQDKTTKTTITHIVTTHIITVATLADSSHGID